MHLSNDKIEMVSTGRFITLKNNSTKEQVFFSVESEDTVYKIANVIFNRE